MFVHKDDQLRAAHLILVYTPLLSSFQVPKSVIRAKDPSLHLINVAAPGFLNSGPIPQGVIKVKPILPYKAEDEATPSPPVIKEEEEENEEEENEQVVEVLDSKDKSEDDFEVFNQPESPEVPTGDFSHLLSTKLSQTQGDLLVLEAMGIQRKQRTSLWEVMESSTGGMVPEKTTQAKLLPPSSTQPLRPDPADP